MLKTIFKKFNKREDEGFSLIELIVVVAILGILVAVAIPVFGNIQTTARHNALDTAAANAATSVGAQLANGDSTLNLASGGDTNKYSFTDKYPTGGKEGKAPTGVPSTINTSTEDVIVFVQETNHKEDVAWAGTAIGAGHSW